MVRKKKIQIVEDESVSALHLKAVLEHSGYDVCEIVATGKEAINIAKIEKPDLIIIDICLIGELDGIDTCREIKKYVRVPVIFVSGFLYLDHQERIKELKPFKYITKPFTIDKILNTIGNFI